jgi:hypothetical protein
LYITELSVEIYNKLLLNKLNRTAVRNLVNYRVELGVSGEDDGDVGHCFIGVRVIFNLRKNLLRKLK